MDIRKLISKFLTQLCEKNYSESNKTLEQIVEAKVKDRVKKTTKGVKTKKVTKKGKK